MYSEVFMWHVTPKISHKPSLESFHLSNFTEQFNQLKRRRPTERHTGRHIQKYIHESQQNVAVVLSKYTFNDVRRSGKNSCSVTCGSQGTGLDFFFESSISFVEFQSRNQSCKATRWLIFAWSIYLSIGQKQNFHVLLRWIVIGLLQALVSRNWFFALPVLQTYRVSKTRNRN